MALYLKTNNVIRITDDAMTGTNHVGGEINRGEVSQTVSASSGFNSLTQASGAAAVDIYPNHLTGRVNFVIEAIFDANEPAATRKFECVADGAVAAIVSAGHLLSASATTSMTIQTKAASSASFRWSFFQMV